jgi:hypothetical protein
LAKIIPTEFSDNLENYNKFQGYIKSNIYIKETAEFDSKKINK